MPIERGTRWHMASCPTFAEEKTMNRKSRPTTFIIFHSILCWLSLAAAAQPLTSRSATANSYLERGNVWFAKGDLERAIADYGLAIASDPNFPYGYYNRAVTRYRQGDLERALADFDRAIKLDPRRAESYNKRG